MEFILKSNVIDSIVRKPNYHMVHVLRLGVEDNLKAMKDFRDLKYRKLHLIKDTSILPGRPVNTLPALADQGLTAYPSNNFYECQDYAREYVNRQEAFLNDQNSEEECKQFILDNMEPVYLSVIKDRKVGFKIVTLNYMINNLIVKFPANKEAKDVQKVILKEKWNINEDIKHMYLRTQNTFKRLDEMENLVGIDYQPNDFIHHVYMAVKNTQMMKKACKRWANNPPLLCTMEQQCCDYFTKYYDELDDEDEQLKSGGIANSVVLQTTQVTLQEFKQELD